MKKSSRTGNNLVRILTALLISTLMCFCMSACGNDSNTEETIEITTPTEETTAPKDNELKTGGTAEDEDDSDSSEDVDEDDDDNISSDSQYAKIYKDCNAEMKKATAKSVDELEDMVSSVSKNKLYDETQDRIDGLKKIYDEGKDKMVKAMLASTEDDVKDYEQYFNKMTEKYSEYTREITSAYTDAF